MTITISLRQYWQQASCPSANSHQVNRILTFMNKAKKNNLFQIIHNATKVNLRLPCGNVISYTQFDHSGPFSFSKLLTY